MKKKGVGLGVVVVLVASMPSLLQAQQPRAFETLGIGGAAFLEGNRTRFHESWRIAVSGEVSVLLPFYRGAVQVGILPMWAEQKTRAVPDFQAVYLYLGWGPTLGRLDQRSAQLTLSVGNYLMAFREEAENFRESESEFALGARLTLRQPLGRRLQLEVHGQWLRVFTAQRLHFLFAGIGLRYTWQTPAWLVRFLD